MPRVFLTACPCCVPLGMESGEILDDQITASGSLNESGVYYGPELARLNDGKEVALRMLNFTKIFKQGFFEKEPLFVEPIFFLV